MANVQHNAKLNQLFIGLSRSMLQYVGQCSSWTNRSEAALASEFRSLVKTQQDHVAELADLLTQRRWTIDFGGFSASITDLHFLSLKYLLTLVVTDQKQIVAELEEASHTCVDDPEAESLISKILETERQWTERLTELGQSAKAATITA